MNKQKQILVLILIIVAAVLVWLFVFRSAGKKPETVTPTPVATEEGKFMPKLNNTLETSVTVINPDETIENQPAQ